MDGAYSRAEILDALFCALALGVSGGIIFESLTSAPLSLFSSAAIGVITAAFFIRNRYRLYLVLLGIFLFSSVLGALRFDASVPSDPNLAASLGKTVSVEGVIESPSPKKSGQAFTLDTASGVNINVSTKSITPLRYGDEVTVSGKLQKPKDFMTDQGTEFDYVSYLYKDNILYQMQYAKVAVVAHDKGSWLVAHLNPLTDAIVESFNRVLPQNDADLLGGLDLGEKSSIDPQFRDDLVTTGTIHIIALSGYNVTIVATFLKAMLSHVRAFGALGANIGGAIGIFLFVAMTGFQSSGVRAGVMALIALFAAGTGRTYNAFRALIFAGLLMVLYDPKYLVYDVSFQLSFLATLGIIFATPVLERAFARVPKKFLFVLPLRELMSATLGAQAGVLPFILYKMGTLSLISLPANILVLPAIPFAMGFGALAGFVGMFSVGLALPIAFITKILLHYIIFMVTFFARVPYASVTVQDFPILLCLFLYAIIIFALYIGWRGTKNPAPSR